MMFARQRYHHHLSLLAAALLVLLLLASEGLQSAHAFQSLPPLSLQAKRAAAVKGAPLPSLSLPRTATAKPSSSLLLATPPRESDDDDNDGPQQNPQPPRNTSLRRRLRKRLSRVMRKNLAVAAFVGTLSGGFFQVWTPKAADASAPVMAVPKQQARDPVQDALNDRERQLQQEWQNEMNFRNQKAREIEAQHGVAAREKFETEWKEQVAKKNKEKQEGLVQLKRDLLDQGIDPFTDYEGKRQVLLYEKGVDLGEIPGTTFYLEKQMETKNFKKSKAAKIQYNRRVVKAMVEDMKNRDLDPLEYFETHKEKTEQVLAMPPLQAAQLAQKYEANLEQYGQINEPKEGEMSALEKMKTKKKSTTVDKAKQKAAKDEAKRLRAEEKARLKAEKQKAKEEAKAQKEAAKKDQQAAKEVAAKEAAAAAAAGAEEVVTDSDNTMVDSSSDAPAAADDGDEQQEIADSEDGDDTSSESSEAQDTAVTAAGSKKGASKKVSIGGKQIGIVPLAGGTAAVVGGGGYALKMYQENAAAAEEERQRQFRLLLGEDDGTDTKKKKKKKGPSPGSAPALEVTGTEEDEDVDDDEEDDDDMDMKFDEGQDGDTKSTPAPAAEAPKKKKRMGGFFSKKKNDRETDLDNLVSSTATAPKFASVLAKTLTYGAPGRFPSVDKLPGEMPFDEFDLDTAKQTLIDAREEAGITMEESAEIFANVVNCMLIDIVDLASSTLKEKDEKVTVNGISVVVDFMNHAASLYDSVAEGVAITPVTYGGSLGKGKLEQMYQAYAVSGMMNMGNMDGDFDSRVGLLQDVFEIPAKKAEGLAMKAMQKNMAKMMKSGEGMEGLEDMMKNMGGMEGLEGLLGGADGEDIDPEQLKQMLLSMKEMKESGEVAPEEFEKVKEQFKEAFGSSLDDVLKEGEENSSEYDSTDRELVALLKQILYD